MIALFCNLNVYFSLYSQENGKPFVQNYSPKEYRGHTQNWDIVQDSRGIIYIANGDGILEYDGSNFRLIQLPQKKGGRSLDIDNQGIVYYGSADNFGYLCPNKKGQLEAKSLTHLLKKEDTVFGSVWQTLFCDGTVYFRSYKKLFAFSNGKLKSWDFQNNTSTLFFHNKKLFISEIGVGLKVLNGDVFRPVKGITEHSYISIPYTNKEVVLGNRYKTLKIFNTETEKIEGLFPTEIDSIILKTRIYSVCEFNDKIILGTDGSGAYIIDKGGHLLQSVTEKNGLQNSSVLSLGVDNSGNLWLALNNGISKAGISLPIEYWNKADGLKEIVEAIKRYNGDLYIATHGGIYNLEKGAVKKFNDYKKQCWSFLDFQEHEDTSRHHFLIAKHDGIFEIKNKKLIRISSKSTFELIQSKKEPRRIFAGEPDGVSSLVFENGSWFDEGKLNGIEYNVRSLVEDKDGILWLGTFRSGVFKLKFNDSIIYPEVKLYGLESGFPSLKNILVYNYNNRLIFGTEGGLYRYDDIGDKFVPDTSFGDKFCNGTRDVFSFAQKKNGDVWMSGLNNAKGEIGVVKQYNEGKSNIWNSIPFRMIPEMMVLAFYVEDNGVAWIGGSEGLFKYDPKKDTGEYGHFKTVIRKVAIPDSVLFYGTFVDNLEDEIKVLSQQPDFSIPHVPFKENSLKFYYSALHYTNEKSNLYRYRLEGFDNNWSKWSSLNFKEYTNLPDGDYEFKVQSKNVFGVEGEEASYRFVILTPWYKQWWAYVVYGLLTVNFIWVLLKFNSYRLKKEKEHLERIVKKRTAEIEAQNEEIRQQAENLLIANEEITRKSNEIERKNIELKEQNNEIVAQNEEIRQRNEEINSQKEELSRHKNHLEELVEQRTKELLLAKQKAEESDRLKTAFLENISHEIRTPMNAILGYTDILAMQDEKYEGELKIITSNFNQLLRTIDNIISLSKLHTKQLEIVRNTLEVEHLFIELRTYVKRELNKMNSSVGFDYYVEEDRLTINGDFSALFFMFKHLLDNAIKYTENGKITMFARKSSENKVEIVVKDTGRGIDNEKLPYIFDLFRKIDNKEKTFRGTGAGLAIVKSIVELHNAEIRVISKPGEATEFIITFAAASSK